MQLEKLLEFLLKESPSPETLLTEIAILEGMDELANYPKGFDIKQLKTLPSTAAKKKYIGQYLPKLGQGSSRAVFQADASIALKVAINEKGLAQNKLELKISSQAKRKKFSDIISMVVDADPSALWIEAEIARKPKANDWKNILGVGFHKIQGIILYPPTSNMLERYPKEAISFAEKVRSFATVHNMPKADLLRPSSWGVVNRQGKEHVVLIDYGLDNEVWDTYYNK